MTPTYIVYGHEENIKDVKIIDSAFAVVSVDKVQNFVKLRLGKFYFIVLIQGSS
jgi:hypothetical protein